MNDAVSAWTEGAYEEGQELSVSQSRFKSDDSDYRFVLFGVHGSEDPTAVSDRMKVRMDDMLSEIADELRGTETE